MPDIGIKGGSALEAKLKQTLEKISKASKVDVGFLEGATYPDGTSIAMVAAINEFGGGNTPARPFFRTMVKTESGHWGSDLAKVLEATNYDAAQSLALMGEEIKGELTQSIRDWSDPPNAPSTIAKKGFDKPLISSGDMMRAVDSEVE
jgi:hypothetical protein